jgi:hypothetical protein
MVANPLAGAPVRNPASYTGGSAIPGALSSIQNTRHVIQETYARQLALGATTPILLSNVGYAKIFRIIVKGTLAVSIGAGSITPGDPRALLRNVAFGVQSGTRLHTLTGIAENLLNLIDNPVLNNKQQFTVANGNNPFYMEWVVFLPYSESNLSGIIYKGGGSTYPTLDITTGLITDILAVAGGATASFTDLTVKVEEERIDGEAPRNPELITTKDAAGREVQSWTPGRGLWEETSQFIETGEDQVLRISGPNTSFPLDLQLGQPYLRIIMIAFNGGQVDSADNIISSFALRLENTTTLIDVDLDFSDRIFREMFYKNRPGGLHVLTFKDRTASDRDILYTRDLGRLELIIRAGPNAPANAGASNFVQVISQKLRKLEAAAMY